MIEDSVSEKTIPAHKPENFENYLFRDSNNNLLVFDRSLKFVKKTTLSEGLYGYQKKNTKVLGNQYVDYRDGKIIKKNGDVLVKNEEGKSSYKIIFTPKGNIYEITEPYENKESVKIFDSNQEVFRGMSYFEEIWNKDELFDSKNQLDISKYGTRYEGEWKDGQRNGKGIYHYADGSRYEGEWKDGQINGKGIYYYEDGTRYEGEWKDAQRNGKGIFHYASGSRYEGEWKDGQINGKGICTEGAISTSATYENSTVKSFEKITIKEGKDIHLIENEQGSYQYYLNMKRIGDINIKDEKRLESVFIQFGDVNIADNHSIKKCETPGELVNNIKECAKDKNTKVVIFEIPGHAFTVLFEGSVVYCFDNGGLNNNSIKEYRDVISNNGVVYQKIDSDLSLQFRLTDGKKIDIGLSSDNFVCRHIANIIEKKLEENIKNGDKSKTVNEQFQEYLKQEEKANGESGYTKTAGKMRINSPRNQAEEIGKKKEEVEKNPNHSNYRIKNIRGKNLPKNPDESNENYDSKVIPTNRIVKESVISKIRNPYYVPENFKNNIRTRIMKPKMNLPI